jgi:hypothetical protein
MLCNGLASSGPACSAKVSNSQDLKIGSKGERIYEEHESGSVGVDLSRYDRDPGGLTGAAPMGQLVGLAWATHGDWGSWLDREIWPRANFGLGKSF